MVLKSSKKAFDLVALEFEVLYTAHVDENSDVENSEAFLFVWPKHASSLSSCHCKTNVYFAILMDRTIVRPRTLEFCAIFLEAASEYDFRTSNL